MPAGVYLPAFSSRLASTRSISTASHSTSGTPGSMRTLSGRVPSAPCAGFDRAADDLLDRLPFHAQPDLAALDARHVEQIGHHVGHAPRLLAEARGQLQLRVRSSARLARGEHLGHADQRRQRRAQVVRQRGEQRVAQALGLHLHRGALRHLDVVHALQRHRRQRSEGLELLALFGHQQEARLLAAARPARRASASCAFSGRYSQALPASVSVPRPAGWLWSQRPLRRADVEPAPRRTPGGRRWSCHVEHVDGDLRAELAPDDGLRHLDGLLDGQHVRTGRAPPRTAPASAPRDAWPRAPGSAAPRSAAR